MAVLAAAAGLADVAGLDLLHGVLDGLPVGHLRLAHVGVHLELPEHAVHQHLEVQFAHAADDGLAGLLIGVHLEGGVLLGERLKGPGQLVLVVFGLGLDGHMDDRLGEVERLQHDGRVAVAERVPGGGLLEADQGHDVAGEGGVPVLAMVGVHLQDAPDPFLAVLGRVEHLAAGLELAAVDPGVRELAEVRIGHDLEGQRREGLPVVRLALELLHALDVHAPGGANVDGLGRNDTTASSMGWTPLFLKAEPHSTGTTWLAMVALRRARVRS